MGLIPSLTSISGTISAAPHNANYSAIRTAVNTYGAFVDQTATITGAWTFSTSPTITNALTVGTGLTVTSGGATITAGGLTVTAGTSSFGAAVTITGTCTATTFSGSGASLTNIPQSAVTNLTTDLAGKASTSHNHAASAITSGTLDQARMPATITTIALTNATLGAHTSHNGAFKLGSAATLVAQGSSSSAPYAAEMSASNPVLPNDWVGGYSGSFPSATAINSMSWLQVVASDGSRLLIPAWQG